MASPYIARPQSMYGQVGAPRSPVQPVDIGGAIDALSNSYSNYIHTALLRRQAENQMALQREQVGIEHQRVAIEKQKADREFIMAGGVPEHDEQLPSTPPSGPIDRALRAPMTIKGPQAEQIPGGEAPAPAKDVTIQDPTALPDEGVMGHGAETAHVPESFDPKRGARYQLGTAVQTLRNMGYVTREEAKDEFTQAENRRKEAATADQKEADRQNRLAIAELAAKNREHITQLNIAGRSSEIEKAAAIRNQNSLNATAAETLLQSKGVDMDVNKATDILNGDDEIGDNLRSSGMTEQHIMAAWANLRKRSQAQAMTAQQGVGGASSPGEAVGREKKTGQLLGPAPQLGKKPAAAAPAPAPPAPPTATPRAKMDSIATWKKANPQQQGESDSTYYQRYLDGNAVPTPKKP